MDDRNTPPGWGSPTYRTRTGRATAEIDDYCRCDVLDTYFVFLRTRVLLGQLALEAEQQLIAQTKQWLESKADASPAYRTYLEHWGDWENPWANAET